MNLIETAQAGVISDAPSISHVLMNVFNFLLSSVVIIAIIMMLVSGSIYFFSGGDEKRIRVAKASARYAVIGIAIVFGAMVVIKTVANFF